MAVNRGRDSGAGAGAGAKPDRATALVTGGTRGIGAAICRRLSRAGAAVFVAARSESECGDMARELIRAGGTAWPLALDVTDPASIEAARSRVDETPDAGPVSWLVNNAGIAKSAPLFPPDDELYRRHLEVNFHGARRMLEAFAPAMLEVGRGNIVNVASSAGLRGYAYVSAYSASKFALVGYTLSAAMELERGGVMVSAVCPYYVDTPMLDASIQRLVDSTDRTPEQAREFFRRENPGGELITPEEVADAVLTLLEREEGGLLLELDGSKKMRELRPNE